MTRRPGDTTPDPPGGRAAERLREFIAQRFPGEEPAQEGAREETADAAPDDEQVTPPDGTERAKEDKPAARQGRRTRGNSRGAHPPPT